MQRLIVSYANKNNYYEYFQTSVRLVLTVQEFLECDDANPPHPPIFVTEYRLKGQSDVTLLDFFTFLMRQGILHHQRRAIKVSLA